MIRIALVAEGVTDYEVLHAIVEVMLDGRSFDLKLLQPEESLAFTSGGGAGSLGGGWKGVYKWCLQSALRAGGHLRDDPLFLGYDLLLIHLDADVADEDPSNSEVDPIPALAGLLPCVQACPPPRATTDALRQVMLSWVGETATPSSTVLCTPSKSTEAWVMVALFPTDKDVRKAVWECFPKPENRLGQQPANIRIKKKQADYSRRRADIIDNWSFVAERLAEARRFQNEFNAAVQQLGLLA